MSRLYKKCFIASGGMHILLALILITCPAFLASSPKQSDVQPITFVPDILIDTPFSNPGGSPGNRPPAPKPTAPAPVAPITPAPAPPEPKPAVKEVAPPKTADEPLEVAKDPKTSRKKPEVSLKEVVRNPNAKPKSKDTSEAESQAREQLAMRQKVLGQLDRTLGAIKSGTGSATKVEEGFGSGKSGPSYASYAAWVLTVYDNAWVAPEDASSEDATVEVSVTIAHDGTVIDKKITKRSGDDAVDASVQRTLDKVTTMRRPFPEGSKDRQRIYIIPFNMKTKRGAA